MKIVAWWAIHRPEMRTAEWVDLAYRMNSDPAVSRAQLRIVRNYFSPFGFKRSAFAQLNETLRRVPAVPILVLHGRQDRVIPVANVDYAAARLPGPVVEIIEGCGHELEYERAEEFNDLAGAFLSG